MREALFIKKNAEKWNEYQYLQTNDPDQVADRFITLLDDLSYSKTFYPHSKVTRWINSLAVSIYQTVYQNKKQRYSRLINFWRYELPLIMRKYHKTLLITFLLFALFCCIGVLSAKDDFEFVRGVLNSGGEDYVGMTQDNIEKGDPFGVYKGGSRFNMFIYIAFHNSYVSFLMIAGGITGGIWTLWHIFQHGLLLGCFQYLFFSNGLGWQSVIVIWIHGTLEVSQWILSATAGFVISNSILFPGTFSRWLSFKRGIKDATKICMALIPITITAAFLEGYITRLMSSAFDNKTNNSLPVWAGAVILSVSFIFIIWYFVLYPVLLEKRIKRNPELALKINAK